MTAIAVYDRYGTRNREECATVDAAVAMLAQGVEDGELTEVAVESAEGQVIEGAELSALLAKARVFPRGFLDDWY